MMTIVIVNDDREIEKITFKMLGELEFFTFNYLPGLFLKINETHAVKFIVGTSSRYNKTCHIKFDSNVEVMNIQKVTLTIDE